MSPHLEQNSKAWIFEIYFDIPKLSYKFLSINFPGNF